MIHHGDLFDVLPTLAAESIDACVTDPPYELGFMGKSWDASGVAFNPATWRAVLRVMKPGAYLVAFSGSRTYHRMACAIEDAGFQIRDSILWLYGSGFPKSLNLGAGKGTALKPAHEPIALAWKPFKGTITSCHSAFGTAALNIDACRIGTDDADDYGRSPAKADGSLSPSRQSAYGLGTACPEPSDLGRWPANVLLDEDAAAALDEQTGELKNGGQNYKHHEQSGLHGWSTGADTTLAGDSGGASRFYYVAKPSREERDFGCEKLPAITRSNGNKWTDQDYRVTRGERPPGRESGPRTNIHPTVKPVALMRWLVRLVTPIEGTVLDPFTGSGTTGMACRYEHRQFVGVEREADYVQIAEHRIAAVAPLFSAEAPS